MKNFFQASADTACARLNDLAVGPISRSRKEPKGLSEKMSDLQRVVDELESLAPSPEQGLPEPVFCLLSRLTPLVSVDLLIRDTVGRTLLTWRHDGSYGPGWHVPGGIVRYKESAVHRIQEVARVELGAQVEAESVPLSIHEIFRPMRTDRGHIVSMLFRCRLLTTPDDKLRFDPEAPMPGHWKWHTGCPHNLIQEQRAFEPYFE